MKMDLKELVAIFAKNAFKVKGVYRYTIQPGTTARQITAPYPGFIFPLSGQAQFRFDDTLYHAEVGNIIHGGANMRLEKCVAGDKKWEYISVLYDLHDLQVSALAKMNMPNMHFELSIGTSLRLTDTLSRLWKTYNQPGVLAAFQTESIFHCALEEMFTCADNRSNSDTQMLFGHVSAYIHERYMDDLTVKALAEQSGVNENQLYYAFRKHVAMGPGDYLMEYRLNRAKELLITGDAPVYKIAKGVGYQDALYFSRAFHKRFGVAPSILRKQFRNNP